MNKNIKKLLLNGKGVKYLLDTAYEILGNPIVIHGMTYNLLAHTENKVTDDWLWNELIENNCFLQDTIDFFYSVNFINDVANTDDVAILKFPSLKYDRICGKLFDLNGDQMGCFTVIGCYRSFNEQDFKDIALICEYISKELQDSEFHRQTKQILNENIIANIIESDTLQKSYNTKNIENLYSGLATNIFVAIVDISQYDPTITQLIYIKDTLKNLQPEYKYFIYLNNIVILISKSENFINIENDMAKLKVYFTKYKMYAGISRGFENLLYLKKHYKQALSALNFGLEFNSSICIYKYDDFLLDNLINRIKNDINLIDYCHSEILMLRDHDSLYESNYINILSCYYIFQEDIELTAKNLDITISELNENLAKIKKIITIDNIDSNVYFNIVMSLRILRLLG